MGSFSIWHWMIVLAIILIVFGAGRLPRVMGDLAKGIKAFKSGMREEDEHGTTPPAKPVETFPPSSASAAAVHPPKSEPAAPASQKTEV